MSMVSLKRLIAAVFIVCCAAIGTKAQTHYVSHVWIGAQGGMTMSQVTFSPSVRESFVNGFTGGVSFRYAEERHVGIQAELNVTQRGWKEDFEEHPFAYQRQLTYVEVPVMTHIFFGSRKVKCFFNLGPVLSYMIGENITADFDYNNPLVVPDFPVANRSIEQLSMAVKNKFDYGITGGVGVEFVVKKRHCLSLEGRYYFGLGNIYPASKKDVFGASRNTSISVTLGYKLRIK